MMAFDVAALRQLSEMPLPDDRVAAERAWRHVGEDLVAAADHIDELEAELLLQGAYAA